MLSSKCAIIYSFFLLTIIINLVFQANCNISESKVNLSLVSRSTNHDSISLNTNLDIISNTSNYSLNHTESTIIQTNLRTEMTLLKRFRRRINIKSNACSHRSSHQDAHKLVDRCARKKTPRRNSKEHAHDSNSKDDTSNKKSDIKWEKQVGKSTALLNGTKIKNVKNTTPVTDYMNAGRSTDNLSITKKRITFEKIHRVNKTNPYNLSKNYNLNHNSGAEGKNSRPSVDRIISTIKGGKHFPVEETAAKKHSHGSSKNKIFTKNKQRTGIHSSGKRISNIQTQKKDKDHKHFNSAAKKLNTLRDEAEYSVKNNDSVIFNHNGDRENHGKIRDNERYTSKSHRTLKPKENSADDRKILSESAKLENTSLSFHDQESKDAKNDLLNIHNKSKEDDGKKDLRNETTTESSLKILKVRRKAELIRNSRATLQQVKAHNAFSRIRKHSHPKNLKRNTKNEKSLLYEVKDFIVHNFPKKRHEHEVKSSQTHKNIHREARNTNENKSENTSRMHRNDITDFKPKKSKILEEIKDFVLKNFHSKRKKRYLVEQNLIPHTRFFRPSKDYVNDLSHSALRNKNNVLEEMRSKDFINADEESDNFWRDIQGIVKRETNSISETVGNFTLSEYDDADDTTATEFPIDVHPQIMKEGANVNDSTFKATRYLKEETYKSDPELVSDQYDENVSELSAIEESTTENEDSTIDFSTTEVSSDGFSGTERNLESNKVTKNDNSDQDNVSESSDSSSFPNDDETHKITHKNLIEREISTVTDHPSVSSEETHSSFSTNFNGISDISTFTNSPITSTFSKSDSTTYESTTPLSTELSFSESKDITSVDSNTNWDSESSFPSSTFTESQENSVETSPVSLSTHSTSEESSSITSTDKIQTSSETRASKVYRDVQHVKDAEDDYEDKTVSDGSTLVTLEGHPDTSTMIGGLNRIQNAPTLERYGNKVHYNNKKYKYKLFATAKTTSKSKNKFDNIKISSNSISKHGDKSKMKDQENSNSKRLASNMNKDTPKSRLYLIKDQKEERLSNTESENEYDDEIVSEETKQDLTTITESNKVFGNTKEEQNLKVLQKKKSESLDKKPQKFINSDTHSQYGYNDRDGYKNTIHDLKSTTKGSKAFANTKGKRINSNIILQGNYETLGIEFQTLANPRPNTLDNIQEESSTSKNRSHTSGSFKPAVQDKKKNNLWKTKNSDEDEYEFQTDSNLYVSITTLESNKLMRESKEEKANLKNMEDVDESMDEALDYPPKLIVLHLRNETVKAETIPTILNEVSNTSRTRLPEKEIKNIRKNTEAIINDEYEYSSDATSQISPTETLETTSKSRISKQYKNRLKKGEKLSNRGFGAYSKSSKLQITPVPEMQPFDDEMLPQTDKPLKETADMEEKEPDKYVSDVIDENNQEENSLKKPTMSPNKKLKASSKYSGLTLNLKKLGDDEHKETESTRKEVERDQTFATYFVTLQNAKIMPDEITTSSTQSIYSDNPRAHESLSHLESINDLGEEYYDEVAHNSQNGERVSKHVSGDNEMKSLEDKAYVENETVGQGNFNYDEDGMNDAEESSYGHETTEYSTVPGSLEDSGPGETTLNDYEQRVSETDSITETPEHLQKNSAAKTAGKDKEFVRHLSSLISHLKQRRRKSQLEAMNHRVIRRARAVVTIKPTAKPELRQVRIPQAKEWWIGGAGIIIMLLLIVGMYHTVMKLTKKQKLWENKDEESRFNSILHRYDTDDEMDDRLSDDVIFLQSLIDQVIQKHEISEEGTMKEDYSTTEHLTRIHAAISGTID